MEKFVQKIEFGLGLHDVLKMLSGSGTTGLRFTIGIKEDGSMEIESDGIKFEKETSTGKFEIKNTSGPVRPCPIPPGCPTNPLCQVKLLEIMPEGKNIESIMGLLPLINTAL